MRDTADGPVEYETERLSAFVAEHTDASPSRLIELVNDDVRQFCAPDVPHDDCTMIALRYIR